LIRLFTPDLYVPSVLDLSPDRIRGLGLEALLLDVDCTLKRYRDEAPGPEVSAWLRQLRAAGIPACLVSNGWGPRIERLACQFDLPFVRRACKPVPLACRRALRKLGTPAARTGMVGDQVFADVPVARLVGLFSILVRPIHPEDEPWLTRAKRPLERWLLRRMEAAGRHPKT